MYHEVRQAGVKGLGVFATRQISPGTRLLAERPLLSVNSEREVYRAARLLPAADKNALMQLSISPVKRSSVLGWTEAAWDACRSVSFNSFVAVQPDKPTQALPSWTGIADHIAILNVFRNNNFDLGNGQQAVFREVSRINHACRPNSQGNFNSRIGRFTIHAVRPIAEGDEITISYLDEHGALRDARQARLRDGYGFLCDCPVCDHATLTGQDSERRRADARVKLHEYSERMASSEQPDLHAELETTEMLIGVYEAEGLSGRELATMYLAAAKLGFQLGLESKALEYSRRGLDMDREAVGDDNPLYTESVRGMHEARPRS